MSVAISINITNMCSGGFVGDSVTLNFASMGLPSALQVTLRQVKQGLISTTAVS